METAKRNDIFKKMIVTVVAIITIVIGAFAIIEMRKAKTDGSVIIELVDGKRIESKSVIFLKGETMLDVIKRAYPNRVKTEESSYGAFLIELDFLKPQEQQYIALYINGEYALTGISATTPVDKSTYKFTIESFE